MTYHVYLNVDWWTDHNIKYNKVFRWHHISHMKRTQSHNLKRLYIRLNSRFLSEYSVLLLQTFSSCFLVSMFSPRIPRTFLRTLNKILRNLKIEFLLTNLLTDSTFVHDYLMLTITCFNAACAVGNCFTIWPIILLNFTDMIRRFWYPNQRNLHVCI